MEIYSVNAKNATNLIFTPENKKHIYFGNTIKPSHIYSGRGGARKASGRKSTGLTPKGITIHLDLLTSIILEN